MVTHQYSELYKACNAPLEHSPVLTYIADVKDIDIADYAAQHLSDTGNKLPNSLRPYIIAVKTMSHSEAPKYLEAYKTALRDPLLNLAEENADFFYMVLYVLLFIQLFAFDEYSNLFYKLYSQMLSLFNIF